MERYMGGNTVGPSSVFPYIFLIFRLCLNKRNISETQGIYREDMRENKTGIKPRALYKEVRRSNSSLSQRER
jgi:hypothetical protein